MLNTQQIILTASPVRVAVPNAAIVVVINYTGSMFFGLVEGIIPASGSSTKTIKDGFQMLRTTFGLPLIFTEPLVNGITVLFERPILVDEIPINVIKAIGITEGLDV